MEKMIKYERPKLVDLTSKEWADPFAHGQIPGASQQTQPNCTNGVLATETCGHGSGRK